MHRLRLFSNKRRLIWWVASYLIIMMIPVITGVAVYQRSIDVLEEEIVTTYQSILGQISNSIDAKFAELNALLFQIRNEQEINRLLIASPPLTPLQIYRVSTVMSTLILYQTANDFISELALYYPRMDAVVTPLAKYDMRLYHSVYLANKGISYRTFHDALAGTGTAPTLRFGSNLYYFASLSSRQGLMPSATVMIALNRYAILEYLRKSGNDQSRIVVLNAQDEVLFTVGGQEDLWSGMDWREGHVLLDRNGTRYLATSVYSKTTEWRYVQFTPYDSVMQKVRPIIQSAVRISALTLVVCLGGALLFAYINYRPLSRLLRFVSKWSRESIEQQTEYTYLESQMQQLYSNHSDLSQRLQQQSLQLGRNYLAQMLERQGMLGETMCDELSSYGIEFPGAAFAVCVVQMGRLPQPLEKQLPPAIEQYLSRCIPGSVICVLRVNADIVCVINASSLLAQEMYRVIGSLHDFLSQNNDKPVLITVSTVHAGMHNLPDAYAEAISAFEQRRVDEAHGVVIYDEEKRRMAFGGIYYPSGYDTQLINRICAGEEQLVAESLDAIYTQNTRGAFSVRQCGYLGYHLCMSFLKGANEVRILYGIDLTDVSLRIENLLGVDDILVQRAELIAIAKQICDRITDSIRSGHLSTEDKIKQYVESHYGDPEMNVNTMSESLQMNPSYVSRVFSEKTGEPLSQFIQTVRIERSLALLVGKDTIAEIAVQVGYLSTNTFIRVFKKKMGITPGKYRELIQKKLQMPAENEDRELSDRGD